MSKLKQTKTHYQEKKKKNHTETNTWNSISDLSTSVDNSHHDRNKPDDLFVTFYVLTVQQGSPHLKLLPLTLTADKTLYFFCYIDLC